VSEAGRISFSPKLYLEVLYHERDLCVKTKLALDRFTANYCKCISYRRWREAMPAEYAAEPGYQKSGSVRQKSEDIDLGARADVYLAIGHCGHGELHGVAGGVP
jgi:hypothetical protein